MRNIQKLTGIAMLVIILLVTGCAQLRPAQVKPWQRQQLARADMQMEPEPAQNYLDEHLYFSKEAASGGSSVGGGGCGCN